MICETSLDELNRFKDYLENKGDLVEIELFAIYFYLTHLIFDYKFDYKNFIHYILGEDREETDDEESDIEMD